MGGRRSVAGQTGLASCSQQKRQSDSPVTPFLDSPKLQEDYPCLHPCCGARKGRTWAQDSLARTWSLQGSTFCANSRLFSVCSWPQNTFCKKRELSEHTLPQVKEGTGTHP